MVYVLGVVEGGGGVGLEWGWGGCAANVGRMWGGGRSGVGGWGGG